VHAGTEPGDYVLATVTDTGEGMTREVKSHLFEPFFTTKDEGTGLGLSIVFGIVKQFRGHVTVQSERGKGTSFKIYIPASTDAPSAPASRPGPGAEMPGGSETILIVEDDPVILKVVVSIVKNLGYNILSAASGEEALERAEEYTGRIDLLLTDIVLPGKRGTEVALELKEKGRVSRVLLMSGYAEDNASRDLIMNNRFEFLPKPFTSPALAKKIRETLDS
jgi:two-component system cell cycle sensor histidine kinase/response regulator CckA